MSIPSAVTKAETEQAKIQEALGKIYTPGVPITDPALFSGRESLLNDLRLELPVAGRNFVLYGERGVGKTSFYNVLLRGLTVERHNCSKQDDFVTIFLNVLSRRGEQFTDSDQEILAKMGYKIGGNLPIAVEGAVEGKAKEVPVAQRRLDLNFVLNKLRRLHGAVHVIVLDEFQNIESADVQTAIIEVVKGLSDENIPIKLVLVGIAESDSELLTSPEYQQYKGRHFIVARIPRMTPDELADIIVRRERLFRIKFAPPDIQKLTRIAAGYPQFAHTLALYACMTWLMANIAAIVASWADKVPWLGALVKPFIKPIRVQSINWSITARDLDQAVTRLVRQFEANEPGMARTVSDSLKGQGPAAAVLRLLAGSDGDDVGVDEIGAAVNLSRPEAHQLIRDRLGDAVQRRHGDRYRLRMPQFKSYIFSLEYLASAGGGPPQAGLPAAP